MARKKKPASTPFAAAAMRARAFCVARMVASAGFDAFEVTLTRDETGLAFRPYCRAAATLEAALAAYPAGAPATFDEAAVAEMLLDLARADPDDPDLADPPAYFTRRIGPPGSPPAPTAEPGARPHAKPALGPAADGRWAPGTIVTYRVGKTPVVGRVVEDRGKYVSVSRVGADPGDGANVAKSRCTILEDAPVEPAAATPGGRPADLTIEIPAADLTPIEELLSARTAIVEGVDEGEVLLFVEGEVAGREVWVTILNGTAGGPPVHAIIWVLEPREAEGEPEVAGEYPIEGPVAGRHAIVVGGVAMVVEVVAA